MERRILLKKAMTACVASGTMLAANTIAKHPDLSRQLEQFGRQATKKLNSQLEALEQRVDKMEHHNRNLLRLGVFGVAVSLGLDLTFFL